MLRCVRRPQSLHWREFHGSHGAKRGRTPARMHIDKFKKWFTAVAHFKRRAGAGLCRKCIGAVCAVRSLGGLFHPK